MISVLGVPQLLLRPQPLLQLALTTLVLGVPQLPPRPQPLLQLVLTTLVLGVPQLQQRVHPQPRLQPLLQLGLTTLASGTRPSRPQHPPKLQPLLRRGLMTLASGTLPSKELLPPRALQLTIWQAYLRVVPPSPTLRRSLLAPSSRGVSGTCTPSRPPCHSPSRRPPPRPCQE
jgi:hypothetical protein